MGDGDEAGFGSCRCDEAGFGSCICDAFGGSITLTTMDDDERVRDVHAGSNQTSTDIILHQQQNSSNIIHQQHNASFLQGVDESNWLDLTNDPLKLTLETTTPLLTWIQTTLVRNNSVVHNMAGKDLEEKLKAINIPFLILRIGTWQKQSIHEGDLVAKCYFGRRKFVWEILEGPLKRKLEMSWSNIIGLQIIREEGADILNLELNQPPSFAQEIDPKPRCHTLWKDSEDFTDCQATAYRRHQLQFPPGNLEKLYNKLFRTDGRLFKLSQTCFPTSNSPYFDIIRNNNSVFPLENSTFPMLQNVPFSSSNSSFPPDFLHQLPPTNNFSNTLIPRYNFHHSITTTRGGPLFSFPRSNMVTSDFNEAGSDGVNIIDHHGRPQRFDNENINVGNGPINILEQNNWDLPPLPVARSGVDTFQTKMEISSYNRMSHCLQGTTTISSHDEDERVNQMNEIQGSSIYDHEATFLRGGTHVLLPSLDQLQGRNTVADEHNLVSGEGNPQDYFSDSLHQSWMPTENYESYCDESNR